jgi:hypothetical protein
MYIYYYPTRVGRYLKNHLTIIVKEIITIIDNIAINVIIGGEMRVENMLRKQIP